MKITIQLLLDTTPPEAPEVEREEKPDEEAREKEDWGQPDVPQAEQVYPVTDREVLTDDKGDHPVHREQSGDAAKEESGGDGDSDIGWTHDLPTKTGWYFIRKKRHTLYGQVVDGYSCGRIVYAGMGHLLFDEIGSENKLDLMDLEDRKHFVGIEWCGPIIPPGATKIDR